MRTELKTILERLTVLLDKNSHEVFHLKVRLSCTNCKNAQFPKDVWICKLYGEIPKEHLNEGCDSWINNIAIR